MAIRHSIKFNAETKDALGDIQKYVESIGTSAATVDRYTSSLAGGKAISQAKNWVAAVGDIGNVSRMTAAEQDRVNRSLDQAIQKYQALGMEAPKSMTDLYAATKRVPEQTDKVQGGLSGIMSKLGPMGGMIAGAFSVGAITSFISGMVSAADQIQKASDKLGDTAEHVQELQYIAGQTGTSFDTLISAAQNLQQRLGQGDEGAAGAMKRLGIHAAELKSMGATEAMYTLNTALQGVSSQTERAALMAELFGKNWKDLAPAMLADMQAMGAEAPKMSDATVAALDKAGDRWDWMTGKIKVASAETLNFAFNTARLVVAADFWEKNERPIVKNAAAVREVAAAMLDASGRAAGVAVSMDEADRISKELTANISTKTTPAFRALAEETIQVWRGSELLAPSFRVLNGMLVQTAKSADDGATKLKHFTGWAIDPLDSSALHLGTVTLPTVKREIENVGAAAQGQAGPLSSFFDAIKTGSSGLVQGLTGGQGLSGFFANIGTGITNQLGAMLTGGMTTIINQGIAIAWEGAKRIAGYFKEIFGGPNAEELAGREVVANFEANIQSMLTEGQRLEANNESWKQTVIVVRDAYMALGKTEAEALAAVKALWDSSKGGADAVAVAMKPIQDALDAVKAKSSETGKSLEELRAEGIAAGNAIAGAIGAGAGRGAWSDWDPGPREYPSGYPGFAGGTGGRFLDFGAGTPVVLHGRERVVTERESASGGGMAQTIIVQLDGQVLAKATARNLPRQLVLAGR